MARVKERYNRRKAEERFGPVYELVEGDRCIYCGIANGGRYDHQPPVYVLHRFADGGQVTKREIRDHFGQCKLVPCCTICNMGLGAYHGSDDNDRRGEIVNWFLADDRYPADTVFLEFGCRLIEQRLDGKRGNEIYSIPAVGRVIFTKALLGWIDGEFQSFDDFPEWLLTTQAELAEWLCEVPRRKSQYFLNMANLESYDLVPDARDDPRGQFKQSDVD